MNTCRKLAGLVLFTYMMLIPAVVPASSVTLVDHGDFSTDIATNMDWLDLSFTIGLTMNQVNVMLAPGGSLEGWRYASVDEVATLYTAAGGTPPYDGWSTVNNGVSHTLADHLSYAAMTPLSQQWSLMKTNTPYFLAGYVVSYFGDTSFGSGDPTTQDELDVEYSFQYAGAWNSGTGSALTRVSIVPIPGAVWLFGSGLIGIVGIRRKLRK